MQPTDAPIKPLHVLALSINLEGWMYETLHKEQRALSRTIGDAGGSVTFYGPGYDYHTHDIAKVVAKMDRKPDVILSYLSERQLLEPLPELYRERFDIPRKLHARPIDLSRVRGIPKVLWINDFWHCSPGQWDRVILGNGFAHVIASYAPPFLRRSDFEQTYSEAVRRQVAFHPMPRGVDLTLFRNWGRPRDIDVALLGAMDDFYPLRRFFHESLSAQSWINYLHRPHPGYGYADDGELRDGALAGGDYAEALTRSKIFVSCTGRHNIPFIKVYEVLAAGSMLMCDRPCGAETLGLVDGENFIAVDEHTFMPKLRHYLRHDAERNRITDNGRKLVMERYGLNTSARRFAQTLQTIGNVNRPQSVTPGRPTVTPSTPIPTPSLFEPIKGGTRLDWARVAESRHVIELAQVRDPEDLRLIQKLGLNAIAGEQPVFTQNPEVVAARPILLRQLADKLDARRTCEVGTARGMQSIFWARALPEVAVYTCDILAHDRPIFRTPLTAERLWSRAELWADEPDAQRIRFVHGGSEALADALPRDWQIDLLYIDAEHTEDAVLHDYYTLAHLMHDNTVLVFDDCDPRFPGVEQAVNAIARRRNAEIQLVSFWPSPYQLAIVGSRITLNELCDTQTHHREAA